MTAVLAVTLAGTVVTGGVRLVRPGSPAAPRVPSGWRVVGSPQGLPAVPTALDCPGRRACYALDGAGGGPTAVLRSTDPARAWHPTAPLPPGQGDSITCPTAQECLVGLVAPASGGTAGGILVARTVDGGGRWAEARLPLPPGDAAQAVDRLACWSTSGCVAHVTVSVALSPLGMFFVSSDGGKSWKEAGRGGGQPAVLAGLACGAGGRCLGVGLEEATLVAVRSGDGGRLWRRAVRPVDPAAIGESLPAACSLGTACVAVLYGRHGVDLARTLDGGRHWRVGPVPEGWEAATFSVACAAPADCTATTADPGGGVPEVESTSDGGRTWRPERLVRRSPPHLQVALPVACGSPPAGCYAVGLTPGGKVAVAAGGGASAPGGRPSILPGGPTPIAGGRPHAREAR